jgi:hypothetical protein
MSLDKMIENGKEALHYSIDTKGVMDKETISTSQKLDKLIVKKMALNYRKD